MDSSIDEEIEKIKNLKWFPWVGDQFMTIPEDKRILVVGESHYHDNTENSIANHNLPIFTRLVIEELAIQRFYYRTKIFPNFHRAIFRNDSFDSSKFWNLIAYYNFVQRPMVTNKGRPSYEDFFSGWKAFLAIVKILKPKTCLFIGTSAANSLTHALEGTEFSSTGVKWEDHISNAYAKSAIIEDKENNQTNIIFIRHTSQMFSWSKWNSYLQKRIPDELDWLKSQVIQEQIIKENTSGNN